MKDLVLQHAPAVIHTVAPSFFSHASFEFQYSIFQGLRILTEFILGHLISLDYISGFHPSQMVHDFFLSLFWDACFAEQMIPESLRCLGTLCAN